ncbi:MAG: hypothetical protein WCB57_06880 [Pseudonocardiaceae bacterium]
MAVAPTLPQIDPVAPASSASPTATRTTRRQRISAVVALLFITAVVANLAIIGVIVNRGNPAAMATAHTQAQTLAAPAAPVALPPGLPTTFGEGKFVVGTDIAPGTYRTTGPSGHLDCYWERLKSTSTATSIIANNLGRGPATVTVDGADGVFQTRWCNAWTKVN